MLNMQESKEKLRLQRNEFANNISSAFLNLSSDKDFTDVTLVCEDGNQLEAHKLVLISSSPFFREASSQVPQLCWGSSNHIALRQQICWARSCQELAQHFKLGITFAIFAIDYQHFKDLATSIYQ